MVCHPSADTGIAVACNQQAANQHNGNDAVELFCGSTTDVFGVIGEDPPLGFWGSGQFITAERTLTRRVDVTMGDTNGADAFNPVDEWEQSPQNTFDDLGQHCPD